ncbi:MAG: S66 family peptidase [Candidatus Dormibacteria bacterium]
MSDNSVFPRKLHPGDTVRVVAPALSRAFVLEHDHRSVIAERFAALGLHLTYGEHVDERDDFDSSSITSRVADLHAAWADPGVAAILTVIGGFNSNELLPHLDWNLIRGNSKVFCGFSDITALQNAILAMTGLVTYAGPHWSSFGMRDHFEESLAWFTEAIFSNDPIELRPSEGWTDDRWFLDQDHRSPRVNEGWWPLQDGAAAGRIVGGNLCTLNLLQGTSFMPALNGALLFVEADESSRVGDFARDLASLLQVSDAGGITGLVIGRFQQASGMTRLLLEQIIERQPVLVAVPILANVDLGHTNPLMTLPIGGRATIVVDKGSRLTITAH